MSRSAERRPLRIEEDAVIGMLLEKGMQLLGERADLRFAGALGAEVLDLQLRECVAAREGEAVEAPLRRRVVRGLGLGGDGVERPLQPPTVGGDA